jgi:hypothetical protein
MMSRWGTVSAHSGQPRWTRWGSPKPAEPAQEPAAGQRSVYLPEPVYPPTPAARPAQPARQQPSHTPPAAIPRAARSGGAKDEQAIAERERIEVELAALARPQPRLFTKAEAFERAALARLQFMRGKL